MSGSWIDFWNSDSPIYVNARHKALHARAVAGDIVALIEKPGTRLLDYGCGEALEARRVAAQCATLYLHDAAPAVLASLAQRVSAEQHIRTLDAEALAALEPGSLDLIVINSVAQYIPRADFSALVQQLAQKLAPCGRLVLGDILPPGLSPLTDAFALLSFGWQGGFFLPAGVGLVRTFFSDYRQVRAALGLQHYREDEALALLTAAGLEARRLPRNLGHNQARMAFEGKRP